MNEKNKQFFIDDDDVVKSLVLSMETIDKLIHELKQLRYRDKYNDAIKVQAKVVEIKLLK